MCKRLRSFHLRRRRALSRPVVLRKVVKEVWAASTASAASEAPISGMSARWVRVAGSRTGKVLLDFAETHSPFMKPLVWRRSFLLRSERDVGAILIYLLLLSFSVSTIN